MSYDIVGRTSDIVGRAVVLRHGLVCFAIFDIPNIDIVRYFSVFFDIIRYFSISLGYFCAKNINIVRYR